MTAEPILALAWLILAHLVADFVLQTERIATEKFGHGEAAWRALGTHVAIVGVCLVPVVLAWGLPGLAFLVVVVATHGAIDRAKIVWTRHVEAVAIARAHRAHETAASQTGLGSAWTPAPAALFALDQLAHLAITGAAWAALLASVPLTVAWTTAMTKWLGGWDPAAVQRVVLVLVVGVDLVIVNVRAGALFVATLVTPRQAVSGHDPLATDMSEPGPTGGTPRVGATIGVIERLLIVALIVTGAEAAIGFVIAAKTLARFRQLDDRAFAEYYLLGTLASVSVALASGLLALAALR